MIIKKAVGKRGQRDTQEFEASSGFVQIRSREPRNKVHSNGRFEATTAFLRSNRRDSQHICKPIES